ncbi:GAMYB transcription factor [Parasponia andersonii]|uniref:GAMYB transcription factor n=1 Tax=Parasponia andersonii TaxID=3476 RepID=A0A2P5AIE6_PARAD|nr:GAMYB transcription factor [Parasponia andersonii]
METLHPSSSLSSSSWLFQGSQSSEWTKEENKKFESALAIFDETTPNRWVKVAEMIPGKSVFDVIKQYKELEEDVSDIEAGRFPIPGYLASPFSFELVDDRDCFRKRPLSARGSDHERKKGVPWTKDEHTRFLLGLMKYGKGDWRHISRDFVVTKTPTQVASHAQKYYLRQHSGGKDKRRPSIHDFTTFNLTETTTSENNIGPLLDESSVIPPLQMSTEVAQKVLRDWNIPSDEEEALMVLGSACGNLFMSSSPYDQIAPSGLKLHLGQNLFGGARYAAQTKPQASIFEVQPSRYQARG